MQALHIHAGPKALAHIRSHGLRPEHIGVIPGAAGGPKGLILGPLDRFIFGDWLAKSRQAVDLVGASIGAWRMATACLNDPVAAFEALEHAYIHQNYELLPGQKRVTAQQVSDAFGASLSSFYGGRIDQVLQHPRYRVHIVTSHGRHLLRREHPVATPVGYAGAFLSNALHRRALGAWLERVVFSGGGIGAVGPMGAMDTPDTLDAGALNRIWPLPFDASDFRTRQVGLNAGNFMAALQASCSIPFALKAVHDIPGSPAGAYWDGGITDYHLHLNWKTPGFEAEAEAGQGMGIESTLARKSGQGSLVLYPHFQQAVVPGWLDKALKWRHAPTPFLDSTLVLAPNPEWVKTLPNEKLPDRTDIMTYQNDFPGRVKVWNAAVRASQQLADEFGQWLENADVGEVRPL